MNIGLPNHLIPCSAFLPQIGGSGVLVQPMTYIFDEEPARWRSLLDNLGVASGSLDLS
jgi:ATP phosphoribosyltransferase